MALLVERVERKTLKAETLVGIGNQSVISIARNISRSGVFVESEASVKVGDRIKLFIEDKASSTILWVIGEIVRVQAGIGFGARFAIDDPAVREDFARSVRAQRSACAGPADLAAALDWNAQLRALFGDPPIDRSPWPERDFRL